MRIQIHKPNRGFSLVELLLTLVLILCLAAASVFTFTTLYRSANLDEGYDRFQSLVRFAQAEAATTGRKVRLQFVPAHPVSDSSEVQEKPELRNIEVTWEADVFNSPGVFQTFTNKTWNEEMVNELVGVERVQSIQSPNVPISFSNAEAAFTAGDRSEESGSSEYPSVTFYPDGSCDSAQIVLASRNSEDERRLEVRLSGILGSVSSRTLSADQIADSDDDDDEEEADYNALFDSAQPLSSISTDDSSSQTSP